MSKFVFICMFIFDIYLIGRRLHKKRRLMRSIFKNISALVCAFCVICVLFYYNPIKIFFNTVCSEISRLAASGMTMLCGLSITSSVTIILRRTGRQCMK